MSILDQLPSGSRVLLVRLRSLGDCVLTTPAIELLSRRRPDLEIAVVVEDRFRSVFRGNPYLIARLSPTVTEVARFRPKLTVNLHGGTRSLLLTLASHPAYRAGFAHFRHNWAYNVKIPRAQQILGEDRIVHTAEHVASAMFFLGVPRTEIPRASLFAQATQFTKPYAVLHPLASTPEKTWPADRFAAVALQLQSMGIEPVFIGAATDDLSPFDHFQQRKGASLDDIKSLLKSATLFIGNDSGPAHMAAAFGLPVVVLFGSSDPVVWAPWKTPAQVLVGQGHVSTISVGDVLGALTRLPVRA